MKNRTLGWRHDRHRGSNRVVPRKVGPWIPIGVVGVDRVGRVSNSIGIRTDVLVGSAAIVHTGVVGPEISAGWVAVVPHDGRGGIDDRLDLIALEVVVPDGDMVRPP